MAEKEEKEKKKVCVIKANTSPAARCGRKSWVTYGAAVVSNPHRQCGDSS